MLDLTKEVNKILREYVDQVEGAVLDAEEKTGKEAVKKLKQTSPENPKGKGKHYKSDWTIDQKAKKELFPDHHSQPPGTADASAGART